MVDKLPPIKQPSTEQPIKKARLIYPNGDTYLGHVINSFIRSGKGAYQFKDSDSYFGDWHSNNYHGHGTYTWENESVFDGTWDKGYPAHGTITMKDPTTTTADTSNSTPSTIAPTSDKTISIIVKWDKGKGLFYECGETNIEPRERTLEEIITEDHLEPYKLSKDQVIQTSERHFSTGSFGAVFAGHFNGVKIAIKEITYPPNITDKVFSEVAILAKAHRLKRDHKAVVCIVDMIGFVCDIESNISNESKLWIVTEYANKLSLNKFIGNVTLKSLFKTDRALFKPLLGLAKALAFLHKHKIYHRDIKPANVLVFSTGTRYVWKWCDFGIAKDELVHPGTQYEPKGTRTYLPPERLEHIEDAPYEKWDVYSFGILIGELYSELHDPDPSKLEWKTKLKTMSDANLKNFLRNGIRPFPKNPSEEHYRKDLVELMRKCWDFDHSNRPTASEVCYSLKSFIGKKLQKKATTTAPTSTTTTTTTTTATTTTETTTTSTTTTTNSTEPPKISVEIPLTPENDDPTVGPSFMWRKKIIVKNTTPFDIQVQVTKDKLSVLWTGVNMAGSAAAGKTTSANGKFTAQGLPVSTSYNQFEGVAPAKSAVFYIKGGHAYVTLGRVEKDGEKDVFVNYKYNSKLIPAKCTITIKPSHFRQPLSQAPKPQKHNELLQTPDKNSAIIEDEDDESGIAEDETDDE